MFRLALAGLAAFGASLAAAQESDGTRYVTEYAPSYRPTTYRPTEVGVRVAP